MLQYKHIFCIQFNSEYFQKIFYAIVAMLSFRLRPTYVVIKLTASTVLSPVRQTLISTGLPLPMA
jgi:hypothetical protein